ncbi:hypothetical protein VP01_924g3 [Puccinia sorghi]|uniref:TBP-associated factor 12 n=1 Tax=Puccinia sorghi TaxID=27349 RepID=A0A0L6U784_9BASI|nr:hypothetical protein VP01_924g3 [Puccinia sorghi]
MNPSFPIQQPSPLINSPSTTIIDNNNLPPNQQPLQSQWAALNTNPDLQRTLCKAAAAGQLNQDQLMSFGAYMKGNPNAAKMFQIELQAYQQQQIAQQQQQQQQKRHQHSSPPPQHSDQDKQFHSSHQIAPPQMNHYQQPPASSPQPIHQRAAAEYNIAGNDAQVNSILAQFKQAQDACKLPNLSPADREAAAQRTMELREALGNRMAQLGIRRDNNGNSPTPQNSLSTGAYSSQPQHPNEAQRAQMSAVYQRQQQIISGMQYAAQANANMTRPLNNNNNLSAATSSPRQNLNLSGRNSPAPNLHKNNQNMVHPISRPGSSHQSIVGGPASSPPAMTNAASPPNTSAVDLSKRRVTSKPPPKKGVQSIGTPGSNAGSPMSQPINLATSPHPSHASLAPTSLGTPHSTTQNNGLTANSNVGNNPSQGSPPALQPSPIHNEKSLSPAPSPSTNTVSATITKVSPPTLVNQPVTSSKAAPPTAVPSLASQQHSAIAAQQQQQLAIAQQVAASFPSAPQPSHPASREPPSTQPTTPAPVPFPPPRPTITGGHATSSTLAGSLMHRPPTNGINEALGQASGTHDASRGQEVTSANRIISKRKIQELVESIDPSERLETEVEDLLLELADEFIDSVTRFSCQLAKHRKSDRLETKDIQLHLGKIPKHVFRERSWNIRIPGFANDEIRQSQSRRINALPSYQSRVAIVREAIRKRRSTNS